MERQFAEGIELFNAGKYFEAHEALEALWLTESGGRKTFLQGLIQVAAAFHHHAQNNPVGFKSLLGKGCSKINSFHEKYAGIDLAGLMHQLHLWQQTLGAPRSGPTPPLPQITWTEKHGPG